MASGVEANSSWKDALPQIQLPASESEFMAQIVPSERNQLTIEALFQPEKLQAADCRAQTIYIIYLRNQVLRSADSTSLCDC